MGLLGGGGCLEMSRLTPVATGMGIGLGHRPGVPVEVMRAAIWAVWATEKSFHFPARMQHCDHYRDFDFRACLKILSDAVCRKKAAIVKRDANGGKHNIGSKLPNGAVRQKPSGRRGFWLWISLSRTSQPALGMRRPLRLVQSQNPQPQHHSQFSDRL